MRHYFTFSVFISILLITGAVLVFSPKELYSKQERRRLAQSPALTLEGIQSGLYMNESETYLLDHFPFRNELRKIKAYYAYYILRQKENNGIYVADGHACKLEYPLREGSVENAAKKITALQDRYFQDRTVYYTVIPDKNYFLAAKNGYPSINYEDMIDLFCKSIQKQSRKDQDFVYIDILPTLSVDDYYYTDTHWRQEMLGETAYRIGRSLGISGYISFGKDHYRYNVITPFYGVYCGQSALSLPADRMVYLKNDVTDHAFSWNYETQEKNPVYELNRQDDPASFDLYDIFLGGAAPILSIQSPSAATNKRLILFRDSYASSLAPLFLDAYREIILIDLRYIHSDLLSSYVDFDNADILFAYNTVVLNNSSILK